MWFALIAWGVVLLTQIRTPIPTSIQDSDETGRPVQGVLQRRFWIIWALIVFVVAVEWGITAWGADFMVAQVGLGPTLALAFVGFLIFWLSPLAPLNVIGLFVAGLGIANLFPLSLAAGTTAAANNTDRAGAYIPLAAGLGSLLAPQVLGAVADVTGIALALGGIVVLLFGAGVLLVMARQTA